MPEDFDNVACTPVELLLIVTGDPIVPDNPKFVTVCVVPAVNVTVVG